MNKKSHILLSVFILLSFAFYFKLWLFYQKYSGINADPNIKYDIYGQDKYTYFGDGRFQVMNWAQEIENLELIDFEYYDHVVSHLYWYKLEGDLLYVKGEFKTGTSSDDTGDVSYWGGVNPSTGKPFLYDEKSEIPKFMILNITTTELQHFVSFEDIPPVQQAVFQSELDDECLENRTCYEEGLTIHKNPFNPFD